MSRSRPIKVAVASTAALVLAAWVATTCIWFRTVICRIPVPGHAPYEVVFIQEKPLIGGTAEYLVEYPDGAITKRGTWLSANEVTPNQIRDSCRVEYDREGLRIVGPRPRDWLMVPGYRLPDHP